MLIYHFGSREGLLAAVVEAVEQGEREVLERLLADADDTDDAYAAGQQFWAHVADAATTFAPLFFELSGQAMQGKPWAAELREWLGSGWSAALTDPGSASAIPRRRRPTWRCSTSPRSAACSSSSP